MEQGTAEWFLAREFSFTSSQTQFVLKKVRKDPSFRGHHNYLDRVEAYLEGSHYDGIDDKTSFSVQQSCPPQSYHLTLSSSGSFFAESPIQFYNSPGVRRSS